MKIVPHKRRLIRPGATTTATSTVMLNGGLINMNNFVWPSKDVMDNLILDMRKNFYLYGSIGGRGADENRTT